jgi:hypothetical protein
VAPTRKAVLAVISLERLLLSQSCNGKHSRVCKSIVWFAGFAACVWESYRTQPQFIKGQAEHSRRDLGICVGHLDNCLLNPHASPIPFLLCLAKSCSLAWLWYPCTVRRLELH